MSSAGSDLVFIGSSKTAPVASTSRQVIDLSGDTPPQSPKIHNGTAILNKSVDVEFERWLASKPTPQKRPRPSVLVKAERGIIVVKTESPRKSGAPSASPQFEEAPTRSASFADSGFAAASGEDPPPDLPELDFAGDMEEISELAEPTNRLSQEFSDIRIQPSHVEGPAELGTSASVDLDEGTAVNVSDLSEALPLLREKFPRDRLDVPISTARKSKGKGRPIERERSTPPAPADMTQYTRARAPKPASKVVHAPRALLQID